MAETKKWSFEDRKRWKIRAILESKTPLHIGNGETLGESNGNTEDKTKDDTKDNANAFIKDSYGKPIIPGSTLKGKIRSFLKNQESLDKQLLNQVFGEDSNQENQGSGGLAIFHDAILTDERDEKQQEAYINAVEHYPDWNIESNTYLEASTAINRHTLTAKDGSLHYQECVPPATQFELIITGDMNDAQLEFLLSALEALTSQKIALGAEDANGKGLMQKVYAQEVHYLDHQMIKDWLKEQSSNSMASTYMQELDKDIVRKMQKKYTFSSNADAQSYRIRLDFCSPFIVNDPNKTGNTGEPNQQALTDALGNPLLPAKSFRGALRSQAERIIRTMGGHCCDTESACKDTQQRCIACEIFGGTGWKSNISVTDFSYVSEIGSKASKEIQQFVAIDRFHGGGKDTALYSSEYFPSPSLNGKLSLSLRQGSNSPDDYAWQEGLLALLFRDLQESDIQFGFGKNKGFGKLAKVVIESDADQNNDSSGDSVSNNTDKNVEALRKKIKDNSVEYPCQSSVTPKNQDHSKLKSITAGVVAKNQFHNPYHFIPVENPIYEWEETDRPHNRAIKNKSHHSHAFYRDKTENGKTLYHGRLRCKITSQTPFFIGKADDAATNQTEQNQASLKSPYRRDGNLAIPATSLRGMVSSIVETASNSALREMDLETALSYRKKAEPSSLGFIVEDKETQELKLLPVTYLGKAPVLLKKAYSDADMKAFIEANDSWSNGDDNIFYVDKDQVQEDRFNRFTYKPPSTFKNSQSEAGVLRILGKFGSRVEDMTAKNNEYFIPIPDHVSDLSEHLSQQLSRAKPIASEVIETFNALVDQCIKSQNAKREKGDLNINNALPYLPKGDTRALDGNVRLRHGDIVFYREDKQSKQITEVSFSAIWRGKVKNNLKDFLYKDLLPFSPARDTLSPAELLFGFIEKQQDKPIKNALSFAGKINIGVGQLSQAFANKNDAELLGDEVMLKELSTPKPPSPALYFKVNNDNTKNTHIEKAELNAQEHTIQGRKVYLHALLHDKGDVQKLGINGEVVNNKEAKYPWETQHPEDIDAQKRKVRITPIKSGVSFDFDVTFNNLTEWELGLMCYSLKPDNDFCHKLGMGKPIGLGSVKIDIEALELIDRKQRYEKDTLNDARYNKASPDIDHLKDAFVKTMSPDIYQALCLVGNPANIKNPVHYPQVKDQGIEDKSYQWFVANDIGSGSDRNKIEAKKKALQAIDENTTSLPTLERYQWNG